MDKDEFLEKLRKERPDLAKRVSYSVEQSEEYLKIKDELEKELDEIFKDTPRGLGFCHIYWATKKRILKEKYGIDWLSPKERNPHIIYD